MCLLKIEVDDSKHITDIRLSDSADSLFNIEFEKNKMELDFQSLEKYLKTEFKSNSKIFLIPFSYSMLNSACPNQTLFLDKLLKKYNTFNGDDIIGEVIFLEPFGIKIKVDH